MFQNVRNILEQIRFAWIEETRLDLLNATRQHWRFADEILIMDKFFFTKKIFSYLGVISFLAQSLHLLDDHAEDEHVLVSHFVGHLHIRAVQCADC